MFILVYLQFKTSTNNAVDKMNLMFFVEFIQLLLLLFVVCLMKLLMIFLAISLLFIRFLVICEFGNSRC